MLRLDRLQRLAVVLSVRVELGGGSCTNLLCVASYLESMLCLVVYLWLII